MRGKAAINALAVMRWNVSHLRFLDDNPHLQGAYFAGIPNPIESRQSLINKPTDRVLNFSNSPGEKTGRELDRAIPATTVVHTWNDIFKDKKDGQSCLKRE